MWNTSVLKHTVKMEGVCPSFSQLLVLMAGSFPTNVKMEAYLEINTEFSQSQPARQPCVATVRITSVTKRCCHLGFASLHTYTFLDWQSQELVCEEPSLDYTSTVPFFPVEPEPFFLCLLNLYSGSVFPTDLAIYHVVFFSLSRHLWICAVSLPVRIKAHVSKVEPRLDATVLLAGLVLTAMCPMSPVKWQLHKGVNKHPFCFNQKHFPSLIRASFPHTPVDMARIENSRELHLSEVDHSHFYARKFFKVVLRFSVFWVLPDMRS